MKSIRYGKGNSSALVTSQGELERPHAGAFVLKDEVTGFRIDIL
jgi:hypothetical protein